MFRDGNASSSLAQGVNDDGSKRMVAIPSSLSGWCHRLHVMQPWPTGFPEKPPWASLPKPDCAQELLGPSRQAVDSDSAGLGWDTRPCASDALMDAAAASGPWTTP